MTRCSHDVVYLTAVLLVILGQAVRAYPYVERKTDPFVALANTLRQQEQRERLEEQQFGRSAAIDGGYYYDYGREVPSDDDLWQMEQIQRQLGRAAIVPFFGRAQRRLGSNAVATEYRLPLDDRDDGLIETDGLEDGGEWYDTVMDLQQQGYEPIDLDEQERKKQEEQLLLDTLTDYLMMYGGNGEQVATAPEEAKRGKSTGGQAEGSAAQKESPTAVTPASTTTTMPSAPVQEHHKEKQPPVQRSQDGTPLGQKEFPMMRPATPQRHQWWADHIQEDDSIDITTAPSLELGSKRHLKSSGHKQTAMSEDELIRELDNLKTKKN